MFCDWIAVSVAILILVFILVLLPLVGFGLLGIDVARSIAFSTLGIVGVLLAVAVVGECFRAPTPPKPPAPATEAEAAQNKRLSQEAKAQLLAGVKTTAFSKERTQLLSEGMEDLVAELRQRRAQRKEKGCTATKPPAEETGSQAEAEAAPPRRVSATEAAAQVASSDRKGGCAICLSAPAEMAFVPCGHRCICQGCVELLSPRGRKRCPACRSRATDVIRIYE
eukprot:TRINITY_DN103898_c0_g1_i1.p1 TRINITY_DN103898_c0_g1~~TRINITY_DN103898_c0_g1_i1.p1  ORF type:complete len:224 (-),score=47.81 TRINITY_DN103898_c0_g1_i1:30-701(-)